MRLRDRVRRIRGHAMQLHQTESGARWFCRCECGYQSTTRTSEALALEAGTHHIVKVAIELELNGQDPADGKVSTTPSHPPAKVNPAR